MSSVGLLRYGKSDRFRHGENMSAELIGILSVGVALAGLILTAALWIGGWRGLESEWRGSKA